MTKAATRSITVRLRRPEALRRIMRQRRLRTQSDVINTLIAEEVERLRSWKALEESAGAADRDGFDDRLL
jgi:hypothetical protein